MQNRLIAIKVNCHFYVIIFVKREHQEIYYFFIVSVYGKDDKILLVNIL